jgi:hypothetical protein
LNMVRLSEPNHSDKLLNIKDKFSWTSSMFPRLFPHCSIASPSYGFTNPLQASTQPSPISNGEQN